MTKSLSRRQFLVASSAAALVPGALVGTAAAAESDMELYSLDAYNAALTSGEPFMLAVLSNW